MNLIVIIVLSLLYLAFLAYLIVKAKDIFQNNDKYDSIKGWSKYRNSFWYQPNDYYKRPFSKSHLASSLTQLPMWAILLGAYYLLTVLIQQYLFVPRNSLMIFRPDSYNAGFIGLIFFAIVFSFGICYSSTLPIMIASTQFGFISKSRGANWKHLIIALILITLVSFPLCILSVDNYGYITEQKISYNPLFQIGEQDYRYDEIAAVTTSFSANKDNEEFYFSYIVTSKDGRSFDVAEAKSKGILLVNQFLQAQNIPFNKGIIDRDTYKAMVEQCRPETIQMVNECYEVS